MAELGAPLFLVTVGAEARVLTGSEPLPAADSNNAGDLERHKHITSREPIPHRHVAAVWREDGDHEHVQSNAHHSSSE